VDTTFWALTAAGLVTGFSKFSTGGMGLIILPILTIAFPGPEAVAILVPMYIATDVMAVSSYRSQISWKTLLRIIPIAFIGIIIGTYLLAHLDNDSFTTMLGVLIISMLTLSIWIDISKSTFLQRPIVIQCISFLAGIVTTIANAAGPLISILLLDQKLSKESYVATRAWTFMIINVLKLPMLMAIGLMNMEIAKHSLVAFPPLIIGAMIGYYVLKKLNLNQFKWLIRIMATIAAIKLLVF